MKEDGMKFIAIPTAARDTLADYPPEMLGVALMLALYCGKHRNSGIIADCRNWSPRTALIRVGVDKLPLDDAPGLWEWRGDDLHILLYSVEYETQANIAREKARNAIAARWARREKNTQVYTQVSTKEDTQVYTQVSSQADSQVDTQVIQQEIQGKDIVYKDKVCVCSELITHARAEQTHTHEFSFSDWLAPLADAVPALGRLRTLPADVEKAARDAFAAFPDAAKYSDAIRRYYAADEVETFRPVALRHFFESLPDVVSHAQKWTRKEDRQKLKAEKAKARKKRTAPQPVNNASEEDRAAFTQFLKGAK